MRDLKFLLKPKYEHSRALIIGINKYQTASPLTYAVNDAEEIKNVLIQELEFSETNITCLIDEEANKESILKSFLSFTNSNINVDDRIFVFFAGHGHTRSGIRGEVGYLVPYDADMDDYSTFIRWDELTRNAELIKAKHILFIMDACYGGLAVNRNLPPGSSRFLKDMYLRFSRQVITAGKADEVVSDSGGPIPNHSVFTGHLIEGIRGKAANENGILTASGLMAYVYSKVANDINSQQTPHYGQFDGDGDFIISAPNIDDLSGEDTKDIDSLFVIPSAEEVRNDRTKQEKIEYTKKLLSSNNSQIMLHDFVMCEIRKFLASTSEDNFVLNRSYSDEEFLKRIDNYESLVGELSAIIACISYWAKPNHHQLIQKVLSRSIDRLLDFKGGIKLWINLRWYPLLLVLYSSGIAAVEAENYESLAEIFYSKTGNSNYNEKEIYFSQKVANGILELTRLEVFKKIPGHERQYTPISEYLFKLLQPNLDDILFLGKGYEEKFDRFEILYALVIADLRKQNGRRIGGPIGRFGWKHDDEPNSPFSTLCNEAAIFEGNWAPLKAGMFGGDYLRFKEVSDEFAQILNGLNWF